MSGRAHRRPYQRGVETRTRLVEAALREFTEKGFEGASTRAIAARADVAQSAVRHHFETKDALWRAAADQVFGQLRERYETRLAGLEGVDVRTRARLVLRDLLLFAAAHPELPRFMVLEGSARTPRLEWLEARHLRPIFSDLTALWREVETEGVPLPCSVALLQYMVIGASSMPYAVAVEYQLTTGEDPFAKEAIEAHADALVAIFLPETRDARRQESSS